MSKIFFHKYQGTGNDFVMIDNRNNTFPDCSSKESKGIDLILQMCERKFGIGADGLILIQNSQSIKVHKKEGEQQPIDFEMIYFNADGSQSLCGNGARCAVQFAFDLGINKKEYWFMAYDGIHTAHFQDGNVHLKMNDVSDIQLRGLDYYIFNGAPHHIVWVEDTSVIDVASAGEKICKSSQYAPKETNVNFVSVIEDNHLEIRTYEKGVYGETLSCGTGVTASAIAAGDKYGFDILINFKTKGGKLQVSFNRLSPKEYTDIFLIGSAKKIFNGEYNTLY